MSDNLVSAVLSDQDVTDIKGLIDQINAKMPFLISLTPQQRKALPKMGDKSVGFDDKCKTYMTNQAEFIPGFVDPAEVDKDRALRSQLMLVDAALVKLMDGLSDTLQQVSSEAWQADLAYYQAVREAAKRGRPGAQAIYDDLQSRFPGAPTLAQRAAAAAKVDAQAETTAATKAKPRSVSNGEGALAATSAA